MPTGTKTLLGQLLVNEGLVTAEALDHGLREQRKTGGFLGTTLLKLGLVSEDQLYSVLSRQLGIPYIRLRDLTIEPAVIDKVPAKFASYYKLMPIRMDRETLTVAVTDPTDVRTLDDIKLFLGLDVTPALGSETDIVEAIRKYYGVGAETIEQMIDDARTTDDPGLATAKVEDLEELAEDASIIRFVNQLLLQAVLDRATDIHVEPFERAVRVRFRVDGILYETSTPPSIKQFQAAIVSRIKIMANLDIAERRLPQDGRIKVKVKDQELDLRVSILPTPYGESVDIRLLSAGQLYNLEQLGLAEHDLRTLERLIDKPHGIIFVTGPTGSGKTTTLYACLHKINKTASKIITIEDPIEYRMHHVTQIQVHPKIGLTFSAGLRSMLRHDPDIMMVGEVRDLETAEITIRVALTGHLVFSTLHTNDAAGGVTRLLDMGIEPFLVASSVECFVAQRLVRLICLDCKRATAFTAAHMARAPELAALKDTPIAEGAGCERCKFTGFIGRTAIYEFLVVNEAVRKLILARSSSTEIKRTAITQGMRTLRQDGLDKVTRGLTTVGEVLRVTQEEAL